MADYTASSDYLPPTHQRERTGSMSLGGPANNSENGAPTNGAGPVASPTGGAAPSSIQPSDVSKQVQEVLSSEVGSLDSHEDKGTGGADETARLVLLRCSTD